MTRFLLFCLMAGAALMTAGCKDEDQAETDRAIILQYIADNNLIATEHESGMFYIITTPGSGGHPSANSTVEVKYKGYFTNNDVFDETTGGNTIEFPLQNLIEGWKIAIPLLQKGGKGTFLLPSALGYGSNPPPGIPRNAVLIFDIDLVDFH